MALQIPAAFLGRPLVTPELVAAAHAHGHPRARVDDQRAARDRRPARARRRRRDLRLPRARGARGRVGARERSVAARRSRISTRCAPAPHSVPVVDLACGRGRNALAIAAHGIPVLGVDRSAEFLGRALRRRARSRAAGPRRARRPRVGACAPRSPRAAAARSSSAATCTGRSPRCSKRCSHRADGCSTRPSRSTRESSATGPRILRFS